MWAVTVKAGQDIVIGAPDAFHKVNGNFQNYGGVFIFFGHGM